MLDDGVAGLQIVKSSAGMAIVQDPDDAMFPSMPTNALRTVKADHVLPVAEIPAKLIDLVREPWPPVPAASVRVTDEGIPLAKGKFPMDDERVEGKLSSFTCPECNGSLWEIEDGELYRFRCRVGHAYTELSARAGYDESVEAALWSGVRALEESASLERRLADAARQRGDERAAVRFDDVAHSRETHAAVIREMLLSGENATENDT
jgi:two-component system chemotaxis response regulator CheB